MTVHFTDQPYRDQPVAVTEGPRYQETAALAVKDLAPLLRNAVAARVAELKASGAAPARTRAFVSYDGPAYSASLTVRISAPGEWAYTEDMFGRAHVSGPAGRLVADIEALREAYNRSTLNTPADRPRYYGSTWIEGR